MRIICNLENAGRIISGVAFAPHPDVVGMLSEDISESTAQHFLSIPGYRIHAEEPAAAPVATPVAPPPAAPVPPLPPPPAPAPPPEAAPAPAAATQEPAAAAPAPQPGTKLDALRAEAVALGIEVNDRWGEDRLASEIEFKRAAVAAAT